MTTIRLFFLGALGLMLMSTVASSLVFAQATQNTENAKADETADAKEVLYTGPSEIAPENKIEWEPTVYDQNLKILGNHYRNRYFQWWGMTNWLTYQGWKRGWWSRPSKCPEGHLAIGFTGRVGWIIDQVQLICAELTLAGKWGARQNAPGKAGGNGGGQQGEFLCDTDTFLVGAYVNASDWLERVEGVCLAMKDILGAQEDRNHSKTKVLSGSKTGGTAYGLQECAPAEAVTSFTTRRGYPVDWPTGALWGCSPIAPINSPRAVEPFKRTTYNNACWEPCGGQTGLCESACGTRGYCCRKGYEGCPSEVMQFVSNADQHDCWAPMYKR